MYKVSFNFPYGKTWLKSFFVDDRVSHSIQIPEFTENEAEAKLYESETEAKNESRLFIRTAPHEIYRAVFVVINNYINSTNTCDFIRV